MENNNQQITQKDIFDLSEQEIYTFFTRKIAPNIKIKKSEMKHSYLWLFLIFFVAISFPFLFSAISSSFREIYNSWGQEPAFFTFALIFRLCFIIVASILLILGVISLSQAISEGTSKKELKEDFLSKLGFKTADEVYKQTGDTIYFAKQKFANLPSLFTQKTCSLAEVLQGKYKGVIFTIAEYVVGQIGSRPFALIVNTKINKTFQNNLRICQKNGFLKNGLNEILFSDMSKFTNIIFTDKYNSSVNLEDINFAQEYDVYGKDQVEARYLLTPTFMERLLKYKKAKDCDIDVFFTNYSFLPGNLFFCIYSSKNMFELPNGDLENIVKEPKHFYNIISEIKEIMQIVEALKLDQDIGM